MYTVVHHEYEYGIRVYQIKSKQALDSLLSTFPEPLETVKKTGQGWQDGEQMVGVGKDGREWPYNQVLIIEGDIVEPTPVLLGLVVVDNERLTYYTVPESDLAQIMKCVTNQALNLLIINKGYQHGIARGVSGYVRASKGLFQRCENLFELAEDLA